jgi:nitrous oxidase accessory protein NosD
MRNCTIENYSFGLSFLPETTYNKVQYNNFLNNTHNTDVNLEALWVGEFLNNYWSDYHGVDANADGLGDTAYIINQYNADPHPMMADPPYTPPPKYEYQAGGGCPGKVPNPK